MSLMMAGLLTVIVAILLYVIFIRQQGERSFFKLLSYHSHMTTLLNELKLKKLELAIQ